MIGSDMDGVIAYNPDDVAKYRPWRLYTYYKESLPTKYASRPVDVIITGRRIHFKKITLQWLAATGVAYTSLIMFPNKVKKTNRTLAEYKASKISELGIEIYYEDDRKIADYLMENCPDTNVVFVEKV